MQKKHLRIIDANGNRVAEGLRVLEDEMRFSMGRPDLSESLRKIRHQVRQGAAPLFDAAMAARDAAGDPGLAISQSSNMDARPSLRDLVIANCKRVQEGLRSLEEQCKLVGEGEISRIMERCRYESYTMEQAVVGALHSHGRSTILDTDLYCLTAHEHSLGRSNIEVIGEMLEADIRLVQYREKDKSLAEKLSECRQIREMTRQAGAKFIVNDDVAIAALVGADGVHVGQDDLPVAEVRKIVGDQMAIGISTHAPAEAEAAVAAGADYIGVGPIFKTYTKKDVCDPVGFSYLSYVVENVNLPFVAIGGIKDHNLADVVRHGACCVAMVTEVVGAKQIKEKIGQLRSIMQNA